MEHELTLKIVTPQGVLAEGHGQSAHLPLENDLQGRGGGDYNIHPGHAEAILGLQEGNIRLLENGKEVLREHIPGGFASVKDDIISVVTHFIPNEPKQKDHPKE